MEKTMSTAKHYINHLTCTLFVVLGLGLLAPGTHAATVAMPTVSLTSPATGATFTRDQTVTITASAASSIGVKKVQFFDGATWIATDTTAPYSFPWAITAANNGSHSLTAKAYDAAGKTKVSAASVVTVNIPVPDLTAPTVSLTSPTSNTTFTSAQTVTIAASATDNIGVSKVELYDGTTLKGTDTTAPYSFAWAITSANNGSHNLTAKAYDAAGNSKVSTVATVTVNIPVPDLTAPTVSLTSPASTTTYTTAQTVTITASASDNVGVSKVELYDGATLKGTATSAPYSFAWAITNANNGSHSFTAKAYDAAGNVASSAAKSITVNIAVVASTYTAPVLNPVTISNGNYLLSWSLPATVYGIPAGGYDVFTDGADDNLHHTTLSAVKSGLPLNIEHCFVVEARWTQAVPSVYPASNKVCVPGTQSADVTVPTVSLTSPASNTTFTSAQTVTVAASAADNVGVSKVELYDGATLKATDTTAPYSFAWAITSANNGSHSLTAKAYDAAGNSKVSAAAAVTVNIAVAAAVYEAPVLTYVQASGSDFLLGWSQPASTYGAPAGGYQIFTDGIDGGTATQTMQQTSVISGLAAGEHCFDVEARWTQAVPAAYPLSNRLCAVSEGAIQPPTTADLGPLKVFPWAKGFGTTTIAGRGGQIIKVTNLNDSGAGSLRAAVEATGPRVIVFEVSGRINLLTNLSVRNPFITIAGQTAPAPGVMVTGRTFIVTTHDVLVQHLSIRVGDEDKLDDSGRTADTIQITGTGAYNIVFDHVSASWAIDEIVGIGYGIKDITFSNCIIAEGLNNSVHPKGAHGYGFLLGDDSTRISLIGNLLAHAADRMPRVQGGDFLLVNNVIYNKGGGNFIAIGSNAAIATRMSAVGNLFLEGPDGVAGKAIAENSTTTAAGSAIYQKDNAYPGGTLFGGSHGVSSAPTASWISGLTYMTDPVNQVKTAVLKNAGARPAFRDAVDKRVVTDTMNQTGRIIDSQRDVGGFPVLAQNKATFNAGTNPGGDDNRNGYTNLEEILYQMAAQVEGR